MPDELVKHPVPEEKALSQFQNFWNKVGLLGILLIVGFIVFNVYLGFNTRLTPNTSYVNTSEGLKTVILYQPNDMVPAASYTSTHVLFNIIWMLVIIVYIFRAFMHQNDLITSRQAKFIVEDELYYTQKVLQDPEYEGRASILPDCKLQHIVHRDKTREPFKWWVGVNIEKDYLVKYYAFSVGAFDKRIKDVQRLQSEFNGEMVCGKCGTISDVRYVMDEEFYKFKKEMKGTN